MELSPIGRAALRSREGDKLVAYLDSVGVWTIGVGITTASGLITVTKGLQITQSQSDKLLELASEKYAQPVRAAIKRPMTQEQFDAFVSICYNIGPAAFKSSTFVRRFNDGDIEGCAKAIMMWTKPAEITSRRQAERDQFLSSYALKLPRARSDDAKPVSVPAGIKATAPAPAPAPKPAPTPSPAPVATPAPSTGLWAWIKQRFA
ncbi:lysozyme [Methylobacterium indicum]|uniref:Lysozyme n=1 Tax=Methylobacterium indicum TaxID=1775910 RepID=A0A8H9CA86_9HYPH|nr:lysozyme [Methylobacterium indicum]BCM87891.1 hypothetical protein mvi_63520 [Methylobacterium indicum]